jgi:hypothetical protein
MGMWLELREKFWWGYLLEKANLEDREEDDDKYYDGSLGDMKV